MLQFLFLKLSLNFIQFICNTTESEQCTTVTIHQTSPYPTSVYMGDNGDDTG